VARLKSRSSVRKRRLSIKKIIKKRVRKVQTPLVPQQEQASSTIISLEILSARLETVEGTLAETKVALNELDAYCRQAEPGRFPSRDAMEAMQLRKIEKRLIDYLDVEHLEACRITGVTPLFYVLELIDIKKNLLFRHPRWVLLPRPNLDEEEHRR
jgi:hypothetical protein